MKRVFYCVFIFFSIGLNAQSLDICGSFPENGKGCEYFKNWNIDIDGGTLYFLYKQPKKLSNDLTLNIYRKEWGFAGLYPETPDHTVNFNIHNDYEGSWAVTSFNFKDKGDYQIVVNKGKKKLDYRFISVFFIKNNEASDDKYAKAKMAVVEKIDTSTGPIKHISTFSLPEEGKKDLFIVVGNYKPFNLDLLRLKINYSTTATEKKGLLESINLNINPNWNYAIQPYTFTKKGYYQIEALDEFNKYIYYVNIEIK